MPGLAPGIRLFAFQQNKVMDGRDKPGHQP
jgi:hypothetical protein